MVLNGDASKLQGSLTSSTGSGTYGLNEAIYITIPFSGSVTVTGSPYLLLNNGAHAVYFSGSGSTSLTFKYTVESGDYANPLDYDSVVALYLNGGTISTATGPASLFLPATGGGSSFASVRSIVVNAGYIITLAVAPGSSQSISSDGSSSTILRATVTQNDVVKSGVSVDLVLPTNGGTADAATKFILVA